MNIICLFLIRNIFIGFAAAAGLLIPLFTTFNLINELEDVTPTGYLWTQAVGVVLMTTPRTVIDIGPFIALFGGIIGLGRLSKSLELTAIRVAGVSIIRISTITVCAGIMLTVALASLDEWVASPLQQYALRFKDTSLAHSGNLDNSLQGLWARHDNEFVTIKTLDKNNQPEGIEIFYYRPDMTLQSYIYASTATIQDKQTWTLHHVYQKIWDNDNEQVVKLPSMQWQSIFTGMSLAELTMPSDSFSVVQLKKYIQYLQASGQPSAEFQIALWQKPGRSLLILAMILLAVPFTFGNAREPGLGGRLALGVIVGLLTYVSYQIAVNLGLLLSLNVQITTLSLPVLLLLVAMGLIYRFDKRY
ncbi:lipopolysaccharide export system permease protein [Kosakonia radicincitans]|uniref:LPS export ABC transporter permease LptG n=1 Tax=Kosakonia radicincitans TaxID=283686 RepID=UPI0009A5F311|nr:LPS export ABC transporter permease LptG [Kosakonia radicincitans]SKC18958.1 lipopolysaccharide export system permease protein [Kosakonia radicincitans]